MIVFNPLNDIAKLKKIHDVTPFDTLGTKGYFHFVVGKRKTWETVCCFGGGNESPKGTVRGGGHLFMLFVSHILPLFGPLFTFMSCLLKNATCV